MGKASNTGRDDNALTKRCPTARLRRVLPHKAFELLHELFHQGLCRRVFYGIIWLQRRTNPHLETVGVSAREYGQ